MIIICRDVFKLMANLLRCVTHYHTMPDSIQHEMAKNSPESSDWFGCPENPGPSDFVLSQFVDPQQITAACIAEEWHRIAA